MHPEITVTRVRRPSSRTLAKQQTRERILASAKRLFAERGYEGATIRDIAADSGLSTGPVFTSFVDKSDLFFEIVDADRRALSEGLRAAAIGETVEERLQAVFEVAYSFALKESHLLPTVISVSWSPTLGSEVRHRLNQSPILDLVSEILSAGIERGELACETNVPLISEMLWNCFLMNFRHAAFEGWKLKDLRACLRDQTRIVLDASRRNASLAPATANGR